MAIALLLWFNCLAPAWAADSPEAIPFRERSAIDPPPAAAAPAPSSFSASDISTEKVSQFVQAYLQVLRLIDRREPELQAAETESESLRIQQEIEAEAYGAIAAAGLSEAEYLQLLGLANTDAEFGERIAAQLQEID